MVISRLLRQSNNAVSQSSYSSFSPSRRSLLLGAAAAALPFAVPRHAFAASSPLAVGGLPVTCNLTLPVASVARASENRPGAGLFEYSKYNGWPEVKESLMAGRIQAA